jgi:hypothetical protein
VLDLLSLDSYRAADEQGSTDAKLPPALFNATAATLHGKSKGTKPIDYYACEGERQDQPYRVPWPPRFVRFTWPRSPPPPPSSVFSTSRSCNDFVAGRVNLTQQ